MDLPIIIGIASTMFFGILAIFYTLKEERIKRILHEKEVKYQQRLEEISSLEKTKLASQADDFGEGFIMINTDYQILTINKTAKDLLNLQKANPAIVDVLSNLPNTYNFAEKFQKAISLNQKIEIKDIRHQDKWLNISINPILESPLTAESKVIEASLILHDTTPEKSLSKMKEDFTSIIVHELRSPLTSIKASSEMLTGGTNLTDDEKKHLIGIISNQTGKMLDEVSTILDSARLDNGHFTLQKTNGDLKKLIEDAFNASRSLAQNKSIHLLSDIDLGASVANFDKYQIHKVINHLLANSLKFTPAGGTITVRAVSQPDKISISVTDTGIGIPQEKQHLIFSKFTQILSPNSTVGTGLGLYLTKGIIEAHGGTITLVSEPNKGTTITFTIPTNSPAQTLPTIPIPAQSGATKKPNNPLAN